MKHKPWENKQKAIGVFFNLSKTFDCVDHESSYVN